MLFVSVRVSVHELKTEKSWKCMQTLSVIMYVDLIVLGGRMEQKEK